MPEADAAVVADDLDLIATAAREAGEIAMRHFKRDPEVWLKDGRSPVSQADFDVDRFLRETLTRARPGYGWLSEETVDTHHRLSRLRTFVVDPIDGTRAFLDGRSTWCVSIAVVESGHSLAGVLECPAKGETYSAGRGRGATCNGRSIAVRKPGPDLTVAGPKSMINALPSEERTRTRPYPYVPSLAYRVALVAAGVIDATFVKPNSHDWDIAAADLILAEAGGAILDMSGERPRYAGTRLVHDALVAGSGALLATMLSTIRQSG